MIIPILFMIIVITAIITINYCIIVHQYYVVSDELKAMNNLNFRPDDIEVKNNMNKHNTSC